MSVPAIPMIVTTMSSSMSVKPKFRMSILRPSYYTETGAPDRNRTDLSPLTMRVPHH